MLGFGSALADRQPKPIRRRSPQQLVRSHTVKQRGPMDSEKQPRHTMSVKTKLSGAFLSPPWALSLIGQSSAVSFDLLVVDRSPKEPKTQIWTSSPSVGWGGDTELQSLSTAKSKQQEQAHSNTSSDLSLEVDSKSRHQGWTSSPSVRWCGDQDLQLLSRALPGKQLRTRSDTSSDLSLEINPDSQDQLSTSSPSVRYYSDIKPKPSYLRPNKHWRCDATSDPCFEACTLGVGDAYAGCVAHSEPSIQTSSRKQSLHSVDRVEDDKSHTFRHGSPFSVRASDYKNVLDYKSDDSLCLPSFCSEDVTPTNEPFDDPFQTSSNTDKVQNCEFAHKVPPNRLPSEDLFDLELLPAGPPHCIRLELPKKAQPSQAKSSDSSFKHKDSIRRTAKMFASRPHLWKPSHSRKSSGRKIKSSETIHCSENSHKYCSSPNFSVRDSNGRYKKLKDKSIDDRQYSSSVHTNTSFFHDNISLISPETGRSSSLPHLTISGTTAGNQSDASFRKSDINWSRPSVTRTTDIHHHPLIRLNNIRPRPSLSLSDTSPYESVRMNDMSPGLSPGGSVIRPRPSSVRVSPSPRPSLVRLTPSRRSSVRMTLLTNDLIYSNRLDWDRWIMMGMIGVTIGIVGFLLHQAIHLIAEVKWIKAEQYMQVSGILQ